MAAENIPQDLKADQTTEYMAVCERHFDPMFVIREYSATGPDGSIRTWPREAPVLAPDAVPTMLPHILRPICRRFHPLSVKILTPDELRLQHGMMQLFVSGLMRTI